MRDYDPTLGRYVQADPLGLVDGASIYGYALQNPGRFVDPTGQFSNYVGAVAGAALAGALVNTALSAVEQYLQYGFDFECWNPWALIGGAASGLFGGGAGYAAGKFGLTYASKNWLSKGTKGRVGEALSYVNHRLRGSKLISRNQRDAGFRTKFDGVWQSGNGTRYYTESKFGTGSLTGAQREAQRALGPLYLVERWTYPWIGQQGGRLGASFGIIGSQLDFSNECTC